MERVIERLELDRDILTSDVRCLEHDLEELKGCMAEQQEDLKELREDRKDMARAYETLCNLAQKIPGIWPARDPVCQAMMEISAQIEEREKEYKYALSIYQEKKMHYRDAKKDLESIQIYLDSRQVCMEQEAAKERKAG